jgi:glycosyltransferase involved in cell wall biosynthesis
MLYDTVWGYKILRHAAKAFALTATEFNDYIKWGMNREKIEIIPNGIDPFEYEQLPEKGLFRKSLNISPSDKIILYLGRIHKIKGLDLLVSAFADYDKEAGNAKLIIVGPDSGYLSQLTKLVQQLDLCDKVIFTGPIYGQEKLKAYVDSDVYVLPSIYEAFPNTVLEACACGTPVIVTSGCGICDTIREIGLVVNYDKDELKTAIFNILSDESLRMRLGNSGRSLVFNQFSWPIIAKQIENAYNAAIDANYQ